MTKIIKYSIYFKNHLDKVKLIDDKIVDIEAMVLRKEVNYIYHTLTFVTEKTYYSPVIIGDNEERIFIKISTQIEDNDPIIKEYKFCIEDITYIENGAIRVLCKSKEYQYNKFYLKEDTVGDNVKDVLDILLDGLTLNYDNLIDIPLHFDIDSTDKTPVEVIEDLKQFTLFQYYKKADKIYFENYKSISKDDKSIQKFNEISDLIDFSTTLNKDSKKINIIEFNKKTDRNYKSDVVSEVSLKFVITPNPLPCSPDNVEIFTDDNNNHFKISPKNGVLNLYYSPLIIEPKVNFEYKKIENKLVVEKYRLENDTSINVMGGIREIVDIKGVNHYTFKNGYNTIAFDKKYNGEFEISYKTDILYKVIPHNKYPKNVVFIAKLFDRKIKENFSYVLDGYYPIPNNILVSLNSDWGLSSESAVNKKVKISKYKNKVFVDYTTYTSDNFGEFLFNVTEYGTYKLSTDGADDLFLDYYINKKEFYMNDTKNC